MNGEEADELLELMKQRNPAQVRLARWVSLAARMEPELIRLARLRFMPGTEPGVEADLWLGPLVETRTPQFIVFWPRIADRLRAELTPKERDRVGELLQSLL